MRRESDGRSDRMEPLAAGDTVYLVPRGPVSRLLPRRDSVGMLHNALLVDEEQSCKRCGTVVLRNELVSLYFCFVRES